MSLLIAAKEYKKLGISSIATDANKRSLQQWKKYQDQLPTDDELKTMFSNPRVKGIATICGQVSGGLEVIDIDCKYDLTGTLFEDFMQAVIDEDEKIIAKLVIAETKSKGYHVMYRTDEIEGNQKLSQRFTTPDERKDNPHEKVKVLIETRGESGYVIAVPTDGYKYIQKTIRDLQKVSAEERKTLFNIARSFNKVIEEVRQSYDYPQNKPFNKSPFQDYNERGDIIALLEKHGWKVVKTTGDKVIMLRPGETKSKSSGDYNKAMGLFSVFTTSSQFEPNKGYRPAAVFAMLECNNDYKIAAKKLLEAGYGEAYKKISKDIRRFVEKNLDEGVAEENLVSKITAKFNITADEAKNVVQYLDNEKIVAENTFWKYDSGFEKLSLSYTGFARFLNKNGFGLYFYDAASPIFKIVHNDYNRLEEASTERIKKFTQSYINNYPLDGVEYTKEALLEVLYKNNTIFSDNLYEYLDALRIDFLRDTKDACYVPFKNGIVEITKNAVVIKKHGDVNRVIWKADLIDFVVDVDQEDDNGCEFLDFLSKISGGEDQRLLSVISIIGYLLHKYKHPAKTFAVILGEETDDESKGGGTGKGIFIKALEKILSAVTIDGKNFKADKSFAYQRVKLETKLVAIQDVDRQFDFEKFYSILTEGWTIEKKNKDELYITYADSPKVVITTNYTINDTGNHAKRRQRVIEFSDYFGVNRTPEDEYGHLLFDDWDRDEWNRFYNFMFYCVQYYLQNGVVDLKQGDRYKSKKIKMQFGEEFLSWFLDYSGNGCATEKKFIDVYNEFLTSNSLEKKEYSMKRFKKAVEVAADNLGYEVKTFKNRQDHNLLYVSMIKHI